MKVIQRLGLDISVAKTHVSKRDFEFAKRIFLDGIEITPFPISALKESGKNIFILTTLLWELNKKGGG